METNELITAIVTAIATGISGAIIRYLEKRKLRKEHKLKD